MWASAPTNVCEKRTGRTESSVPYKDLQWNENILHHRRIRRCAIISTAGCFTIFPARQLFPMGALSPRRRRCSLDLQRDFRVLAAMFFCGLILWLAVQSNLHLSASFCPLFLARQKKWVCEATAAVSPRKRQSGESGQAGCCAESPPEALPAKPKKKKHGVRESK